MSDKRTFRSDFRRRFAKGLVVLLPTAVTLIILVKAYQFFGNTIGNPINRATQMLIARVGLEPAFVAMGLSESGTDAAGNAVQHVHIPGVFGFLIAIVGVYFVGSFFASYLGRKLMPLAEGVLTRIPIFKVIYPYARQVTDFFLEDKKQAYEIVVAVPYPRKGIYSVGFLTGDGMKTVSEAAGTELVNVFIPSSPTPVTGYTIFVDPDEIIPLEITVDQALRFTISGGVIIPPSQVQTLRISHSVRRASSPSIKPAPSKKETT